MCFQRIGVRVKEGASTKKQPAIEIDPDLATLTSIVRFDMWCVYHHIIIYMS